MKNIKGEAISIRIKFDGLLPFICDILSAYNGDLGVMRVMLLLVRVYCVVPYESCIFAMSFVVFIFVIYSVWDVFCSKSARSSPLVRQAGDPHVCCLCSFV